MAITVRTEAVADIGSLITGTAMADNGVIIMEHTIIRLKDKAVLALKNNILDLLLQLKMDKKNSHTKIFILI